jgi:hypothetical protein
MNTQLAGLKVESETYISERCYTQRPLPAFVGEVAASMLYARPNTTVVAITAYRDADELRDVDEARAAWCAGI